MSLDNILLIPGLGAVNLQSLLFGAGEVGGLYDWSDRSTMFQDLAGTQPITASGQTRALHLDKSKGLVPGPELVTNGEFNASGSWTLQTGFSITGGQLVFAGSSGLTATQTSVLAQNKRYRIEIDVAEINSGSVNFGMGLSTFIGLSVGPNVFTRNHTEADSRIRFISGEDFKINSISVKEIAGNHRYQANASSRPQYIEDETGHYGLYDGVDDWDETNAVDFTGTDKMTVWWGGRKLSALGTASAAYGLTADPLTLPNSFELQAPGSLAEYQISSAGTIRRTTITESFPAPDTAVITQISDIAAPSIVLRRNGSSIASTISSQGTGDYANAKLYFGRRGGITVSANIREYMTIIRGAETPLATIETVEREVRRKIKGLTW